VEKNEPQLNLALQFLKQARQHLIDGNDHDDVHLQALEDLCHCFRSMAGASSADNAADCARGRSAEIYAGALLALALIEQFSFNHRLVALTCIEASLVVQPRAFCHYFAGCLYDQQGNSIAASDHYREAYRLEPGNRDYAQALENQLKHFH